MMQGWLNRYNTCLILSIFFILISFPACITTPLPELERKTSRHLAVSDWNVHFHDYTEGSDSLNVKAREVADSITQADADIVTLQEVAVIDFPEVVQPNLFLLKLQDLLTNYAFIYPKGSSQLANTQPVLFKSSRFAEIESGIKWISDTPFIPDSTMSENVLPRYFTFVLLYDFYSDNLILVVNTHLSPVLLESKSACVKLLADFISCKIDAIAEESSSRISCLLCGDFNISITSPLLRPLKKSMKPAISPAEGNTLSKIPLLCIDTIFYTGSLQLISAGIEHSCTVSDHYPIYAYFIYD